MTRIMLLLALVLATDLLANSVSKLMTAAQRGEVAIVAQLIKQIPIDSRDEHARTAVHYAVMHKQLKVLDLLVANNADVNIIDADGKTPFDIFIDISVQQFGDQETSSKVINSIRTTLHHSKADTAKEVVDKLDKDEAEALRKRQAEMLFIAAESGDREAVELLLQEGVDPKSRNAAGEFPSHVATRNKHFVVTAILLKAIGGVDQRDDKSWTPMHWLVLAKEWEMVREYMREGATLRYKVQSDYWPRQDVYDIAIYTRQEDKFIATAFEEGSERIINDLMQKATRQNKLDLYQKLLENGLDLQDEETANTAAMYAFSYTDAQSLEAIRFLLENNINKSSVAKKLSSNSVLQSSSIMQLMLDYGIDPNTQDASGGTALIAAVRKANMRPDMLRMLLDNDADPNVRGKNGESPLIELVQRVTRYRNYRLDSGNYLEFLQILLEYGADPNVMHGDKSALDILNEALQEYEQPNHPYHSYGNSSEMEQKNIDEIRKAIDMLVAAQEKQGADQTRSSE